tara:strand:- start:136 stop:309 length:174 start_codon:yes stop_codon:yes gene_type:complete
MHIYKTIDKAIDGLEKSFKPSRHLISSLYKAIEGIKRNGITKFAGDIYIVDKHNILN